MVDPHHPPPTGFRGLYGPAPRSQAAETTERWGKALAVPKSLRTRASWIAAEHTSGGGGRTVQAAGAVADVVERRLTLHVEEQLLLLHHLAHLGLEAEDAETRRGRGWCKPGGLGSRIGQCVGLGWEGKLGIQCTLHCILSLSPLPSMQIETAIQHRYTDNNIAGTPIQQTETLAHHCRIFVKQQVQEDGTEAVDGENLWGTG